MGWGFSFIAMLSLFSVVFLVFNVVESIKNIKTNRILGKRYREQKYYQKDLDKCPKCGHPYCWGQIRREGFFEVFVIDKYYVDEFDCYNHDCDFKVEVILKWDKKKWDYV